MRRLSLIIMALMLVGCSSKSIEQATIQPTETPLTPISTNCNLASDGMEFNIMVNGHIGVDVTDIILSVKSSYEELGSTPEELAGMNQFMADYLSNVLATSLNIEDVTEIDVDVENLFDDNGLNYQATIPTDVLAKALEINATALTVETLQDELSTIGFACNAF